MAVQCSGGVVKLESGRCNQDEEVEVEKGKKVTRNY
jgi:hypothetical protein